MASQPARESVWLHGPVSDLLLGCGGLYLLLLLPLGLLGEGLRLAQPLLLLPVLTMLISGPHYGATLLRVYEDRHDRRAYAIFSVWATAAIIAAVASGLWLPSIGSFLVTLYLTWSPWHYTGQNYGIAVMFLRRSGAPLDEGDKRWVYLSFVLSFVLIALFMHTATGSARDIPVYNASELIHFRALGIPASISALLIPVVALGYLASLAIAFVRLSRHRSARELLPFALLSLSQVFWFVLPLGATWAGWQPAAEIFRAEERAHYFMWIGLAHAAQYLWVTSYYARHSKHWNSGRMWYAKIVSAGSAAWMLPALLLGPIGFGPLSLDLGLAMLIAAGVNLHHFVLDGAIWKLRGRIAEVLIRSGRDDSGQSSDRSLWRSVVWAACAAGLALQIFHTYYEAQGRSARRMNESRQAFDRLAWFGLDTVQSRMRLAQVYLSNERPAAAISQIQRGLELTPSAGSYLLLGQALLRNGEPEAALSAFREAATRSPGLVAAHRGEAVALLRLGDREQAVVAMDEAVRLAPDDESLARQREALFTDD